MSFVAMTYSKTRTKTAQARAIAPKIVATLGARAVAAVLRLWGMFREGCTDGRSPDVTGRANDPGTQLQGRAAAYHESSRQPWQRARDEAKRFSEICYLAGSDRPEPPDAGLMLFVCPQGLGAPLDQNAIENRSGSQVDGKETVLGEVLINDSEENAESNAVAEDRAFSRVQVVCCDELA